MTVGSIEAIVREDFKKIRDECSSERASDHHSFDESALIVSPNTIYMNYVEYRESCLKLPFGIDLKQRGEITNFGDLQLVQTEPANIQILDNLRTKGMTVIFVVQDVEHGELLKWFLEEFGYHKPDIVVKFWNKGELSKRKIYMLTENIEDYYKLIKNNWGECHWLWLDMEALTILKYIKYVDENDFCDEKVEK